MKNLRLNENKIRDVTKRGIILVTALFTFVTFKECSKIKKIIAQSIVKDYNSLDDYTKTITENGISTQVYSGKNIALTIDKDTYEVKEYIYEKTILGFTIYDLTTGHKIATISFLNFDDSDNIKVWNEIKENNYVVIFANIGDYIEDEKLKEYYSLIEIKNLESKIINNLMLTTEHRNDKTKKR